jgi:hypothetical protein
MAYKDKMEITMGVAVGSSVQVAVFVIPFMVVSGWVMGKPLSLDFQPYESVTAVMSVLIVNVIIRWAPKLQPQPYHVPHGHAPHGADGRSRMNCRSAASASDV